MSLTLEEFALTGLERLGLTTATQRLDQIAQQAAAQQWSYTHFLGAVLEAELAERHRRTVALNLQFAKFPGLKRLGDFDFAAQPSLDRWLVDELATGRFLGDGRNLFFLGPPGVGKTHLAIGLGVMTAELGHRVYFTTLVECARRLQRFLAENRLHRELNNLTRPKLLILDEVGYVNLDAAQASLIFQALAKRYDTQGATIITSNKAFSDWGGIFAGDSVMAGAVLDRLLHRSTVVHIRGESFRLKEKRQASATLIPTVRDSSL